MDWNGCPCCAGTGAQVGRNTHALAKEEGANTEVLADIDTELVSVELSHADLWLAENARVGERDGAQPKAATDERIAAPGDEHALEPIAPQRLTGEEVRNRVSEPDNDYETACSRIY